MKTREELEAMTKDQLDAYGNEHFGIDLDSRRKKGDMITCLLEAQAKKAAEQEAAPQSDQPNDDEPDEISQDAADPEQEQEAELQPEEQVTTLVADGRDVVVTVTDYTSSSGVPLFVNGREFHFPIRKPVRVPAFVPASLAAVAEVTFTIETIGDSQQ